METFSASVTRNFDVFFDLRLNKRLSKQSWSWWFETLSRPLWRHCNGLVADITKLPSGGFPWTSLITNQHWFRWQLGAVRQQAITWSNHYDDVIMMAIASQITSLTIVYSAVYSGAHQRKHQSSASLAFVWGIHRGPVNSPHKWPVTRKMFPFDDVIMCWPISVSPNGVTKPRWFENEEKIIMAHSVTFTLIHSKCAI